MSHDIETKHGTLSIEVEIDSTDKVGSCQTLDFSITISPPPGFTESNFDSRLDGNKIIVVIQTVRDGTP